MRELSANALDRLANITPCCLFALLFLPELSCLWHADNWRSPLSSDSSVYFVTHRDCVCAGALAGFQCYYLSWLWGDSFSSTSLSDDWKNTECLWNHSSSFPVAQCTGHYSKLGFEHPKRYVLFACRITLVSESSLDCFGSSRILQSDDSEGPAIVLLYTLYLAFTFSHHFSSD